MNKYNALDISKHILNKCYNDKKYISNIRLQRILFIIQVEWLRTYNDILFTNNIEAWHYGPVIESVYYEYFGYGGIPIKEYYPNFDLYPKLELEKIQLIDKVIVKYREKPPCELVKETHKENGSWYQTYKKYGHGCTINISLIKNLDIQND